MHDIKFRAWDNLEKRMREVVSLHWRDGKLVSAKLEGENEPTPIEGRLVIQQYIDLYDIHNNQVGEGDICVFSIGPDVHAGTIVWIDDESGFGLHTFIGDKEYELPLSDSQIIGVDLGEIEVNRNICGEPELLEEK